MLYSSHKNWHKNKPNLAKRWKEFFFVLYWHYSMIESFKKHFMANWINIGTYLGQYSILSYLMQFMHAENLVEKSLTKSITAKYYLLTFYHGWKILKEKKSFYGRVDLEWAGQYKNTIAIFMHAAENLCIISSVLPAVLFDILCKFHCKIIGANRLALPTRTLDSR